MAVDIYLKVADIAGESQDAGHKGEIDVLSWSWGLSQTGTMHMGGGGGAGRVNVQDLSFTHHVDKASPNLMKFCCNGKHFPEAKLTVRKAGENPLEYMVITMNDVLISGVSTGAAGSDERQTENVTLNFGAVKVSYQPQKKDGSKDGGPIEMSWNIAKNAEK